MHAFVGERIENAGSRDVARAVIEGEHDLSGSEREGLRELLAAEARRRCCIDSQNAHRAQRVRIAGAGELRPRGRSGDRKRRCGGRALHDHVRFPMTGR